MIDDHENTVPPYSPQFKPDGIAMRLEAGADCVLRLEKSIEELTELKDYLAKNRHVTNPVNLSRIIQVIENCRRHIARENKFLDNSLT